MKIKSKRAYCVIKKSKPAISLLEIYDTRDITLEKNEELWEVMIMPIKKVGVIHSHI